jgi:transposase
MADATGRPPLAADLSAKRLVEELKKQPLEFGYAATVWTAPLLSAHLRGRYGYEISARTLRRRLHAAGLRWKRPRYVFARKEPNRAQKKGLLCEG